MSSRYARSQLKLTVLGIITILTLAIWSGSKIYRQYQQRQPIPELEPILQELNPVLNLNSLEQAEQRNYFPINLEDFKINPQTVRSNN